MAVRPYWWCQRCGTTHDSAVERCVQCGAAGLAKRQARVASAEPGCMAPGAVVEVPPGLMMVVPAGTAVSRRDLSNEVGAIVEYRGERPSFVVPNPECGPGIAALALKAPPRAKPPRHETESWDPYGVSLPDAESGRYGRIS